MRGESAPEAFRPHPVYDFGMRSLILILALMLPVEQRSPADPLQHLPPNIEVLTHFGERADISPDNQRVAFMAKSFGDAMVIDLKTRVIPLPDLQCARRRFSCA